MIILYKYIFICTFNIVDCCNLHRDKTFQQAIDVTNAYRLIFIPDYFKMILFIYKKIIIPSVYLLAFIL